MVFQKELFIWRSITIFSFIGFSLMEVFKKSANWRQICKQKSWTFYISNDVSIKRVVKKKLFIIENYKLLRKKLWRHKKDISLTLTFTPLRNSCLITFKKFQKQLPEKFCKKTVLKFFCNIHRRKPVLETLFNSKYYEIFYRTYIVKNVCEWLLLKMFLKLRKAKTCW